MRTRLRNRRLCVSCGSMFEARKPKRRDRDKCRECRDSVELQHGDFDARLNDGFAMLADDEDTSDQAEQTGGPVVE